MIIIASPIYDDIDSCFIPVNIKTATIKRQQFFSGLAKIVSAIRGVISSSMEWAAIYGEQCLFAKTPVFSPLHWYKKYD